MSLITYLYFFRCKSISTNRLIHALVDCQKCKVRTSGRLLHVAVRLIAVSFVKHTEAKFPTVKSKVYSGWSVGQPASLLVNWLLEKLGIRTAQTFYLRNGDILWP